MSDSNSKMNGAGSIGRRAEVHGTPGDRARGRGILRALGPLLAALFLYGLLLGWALGSNWLKLPNEAAGAAFLVMTALLMLATRSGVKSLAAFFKGARGEERVAALLAELPEGWHVFHDLACVPGGIDHVAVGERGLFAIETKRWAGEVRFGENGELLVDGKRPSRPPLGQAERSALALDAYLESRMEDPPKCHAVLCFASETFRPGLAEAERVAVCNASVLQSLLVTHEERLSAQQVERIAKVLEQKEE